MREVGFDLKDKINLKKCGIHSLNWEIMMHRNEEAE